MIAMYGSPPIFPPMPESIPGPGTAPEPIDWGKYRVIGQQELPAPECTPPTIPEPADLIKRRITERMAWLESELRMHDAYKLELDVLRGWLERTTEPSSKDQEKKT